LAVTIDGKSIVDVSNFHIDEAVIFTENLPKENERERHEDCAPDFQRNCGAIKFLQDVGLKLSNSRSLGRHFVRRGSAAHSLGHPNRLGLTGVLYILDEPSIGLHQRDNDRLLKTLKNLRDLGNTVIVVEHDEETIWESDWVVDIGPGAGKHGGELVAEGTPSEVAKDKNSLTGKYLAGIESVAGASERRKKGNGKTLKIVGATEHNSKMSMSKFLWVNL
jgi:excinuclease ABC subunit A